MTTPLYKDHRAPELLPRSAHAGLWFDKFCNQWQRNPEQSGLKSWSLKSFTGRRDKDRVEVNPKLDWIRTVTGSPVGNEKLLDEYTKRLGSMASALGGSKLYLKTASRFATGLGREHPIENGFAWHPTLGVPYLPGSSVKGLVRAWIRILKENGSVDEKTEREIFGGEKSEHVGSVIFFDAIPIRPVQLEADVMTPHYDPYYQDSSGKTAPGDWHSPIPIPFLTVASDQGFLFALAPRIPSNENDCSLVAGWLKEALRNLGAGAKTAVGYGRFLEFDPRQEAETPQPVTKARQPKVGEKVMARRIEDPKGKGRVWFETDDGFKGVVAQGSPPQVEVGQSVELEIAAITGDSQCNFRIPVAKPPPSQKQSQNRKRWR